MEVDRIFGVRGVSEWLAVFCGFIFEALWRQR
jgi:hypothetical protein